MEIGEPRQEPQTSLLISEPGGSPFEALGGQKEPPESSRTLEGVLALATLLLKSTQLKSLLFEPQFFHL